MTGVAIGPTDTVAVANEVQLVVLLAAVTVYVVVEAGDTVIEVPWILPGIHVYVAPVPEPV